MRSLRSCVPFALCICLSVLLAGCGDDDGPIGGETAPTPPPVTNPTPPTNTTPPTPTFAVSGTIFETAPTETQRISGVQVAVGDATATTNGNGDFTVTGVTSGSKTLTASRTNYVTQTMSVNVNDANVSGIRIALASTSRTIESSIDGSIATGDATCHGTSKPCDAYNVGAHTDGNVQAFVTWKDPTANIDLELRCNEQTIEEANSEASTGIEELHPTPVRGGQKCQLNVILRNEAQTLYTVHIKYPY